MSWKTKQVRNGEGEVNSENDSVPPACFNINRFNNACLRV
jgi:hypothetical protein